MKQHWKKIHLQDNILGHYFRSIFDRLFGSLHHQKPRTTHTLSPVTILAIHQSPFTKFKLKHLVNLCICFYSIMWAHKKSDENVIITAVVVSSAEHDKKRNWFLCLWSHRLCLHWVKCMHCVHSSLIPYDCVIKRSTVSDRLFDCTQLFQFNIPHRNCIGR